MGMFGQVLFERAAITVDHQPLSIMGMSAVDWVTKDHHDLANRLHLRDAPRALPVGQVGWADLADRGEAVSIPFARKEGFVPVGAAAVIAVEEPDLFPPRRNVDLRMGGQQI